MQRLIDKDYLMEFLFDDEGNLIWDPEFIFEMIENFPEVCHDSRKRRNIDDNK